MCHQTELLYKWRVEILISHNCGSLLEKSVAGSQRWKRYMDFTQVELQELRNKLFPAAFVLDGWLRLYYISFCYVFWAVFLVLYHDTKVLSLLWIVRNRSSWCEEESIDPFSRVVGGADMVWNVGSKSKKNKIKKIPKYRNLNNLTWTNKVFILCFLPPLFFHMCPSVSTVCLTHP